MRISTSLFYDRASTAMASLTKQADALQTAIATGKKLAAPSSDAIAYRQLSGLSRAATDATQDGANVTLASALLTASDTALGQIETQLQRASELAVRAGNGTLNQTERTAFAQELDAIVEDLVRLANSTDSRGGPLFSGSSEAVPYAIQPDGSVAYSGTGEASAIPIGTGASIHATTSGEQVFDGIPVKAGGTSDMFAIVRGLADRLRGGGGGGDAAADLKSALTSISDARASIGARGARLELETARLASAAETREVTRSGLEDTDIAATVTELQKTLTVLQATQASFTKLTQLSLFDYLR